MKLILITLAAFAVFALTTDASAQTRQATPIEVQPNCMVKQETIATPGGQKFEYLSERIILDWYTWGGYAAQYAWRPNLSNFGKECFNRKEKGKCGLPYDKTMYKALTDGISNASLLPGGIIYEYFQKPPPAEAINFAAQSIGQCFGSDSPSLEAIGWQRVDYPFGVCAFQSRRVQTSWIGAYKPEKVKKIRPDHRATRNWSIAIKNMRLSEEDASQLICGAAPSILSAALEDSAASYYEDLEILEERRLAKERFDNRPVEERIAGLNGCQIAYSLVFNGINASESTVGRVPDAAISWALNYEKANLAGEDCPTMPDVLSEWVQQQPLTKFEPVSDPYTEFRSRKGPSFGKDFASWSTFAKIWMSRYDTRTASTKPINSRRGTGSHCDAVLYYARSNERGTPQNADNGPSAFQTLARLGYSAEASAAMCQYAPSAIFAAAESAWNAKTYKEEQEIQAAARAQAELDARLSASQNSVQGSYLWKNAPTTRCYWSGETKNAQKSVCFTN